MSKIFAKDSILEERVSSLEKYLEDLSLHRDSRRGPQGDRGEKGEPGIGIVGPAGPAGKDADISQAVTAAKQAIEEQFGFYLNAETLRELIVHQLVKLGYLDVEGNPIHKPGPAGAPSNVPGPRGETGPAGRDGRDGVDGKDGKDGRDGERGPAGHQGERGPQGEPGVSNIPGPQGEAGPEGPQGITGAGLTKEAVVSIILDMRRRGAI